MWSSSRSGAFGRITQRAGLKALSLVLAVAGWAMFASDSEIVERTFVVQIEYGNVPANLRLDEPIPVDVHVTLSGPKPAFALLTPSELKVSVDLRNQSEGT